MSSITPLINYIIFLVDKEAEDSIETKIGTLYLDSRFEAGKHARKYGKVIGVPKTLTKDVVLWRNDEGLPAPISYYSGELVETMARTQSVGEYYTETERREFERRMRSQLYDPSCHEPTYKTLADIEPEVQNGDKIYFHFNTIREDSRIPTKEGYKAYMVRYDQVFCAVRDEKIIPIGGHVLIDSVWEEGVEEIELKGHEKVRGTMSRSGLITSLHDKPKPLIGKIAYIGAPLKGEPDLDLKPGDEIYYLPESDWVNEVEGKSYYIMKQKDIIAKIN